MVAFKLLLAATVSGFVTAWPDPTPAAHLDNRAIDCSKVTGALSVLKKVGPPGTTFCSSFLKIPGTKTATTTFTPATVTSTTSTSTVTVTSTACGGQQKRNAPVGYRGFEYARAADVEVVDKRTDVLALLAAFAAAKISEGCSCLNLQPEATKTATLTASAPTVKVVATSTTCVVAQPVCKANGIGNACTQNSDCCAGQCGSVGGSDCCQPSGGPCDLNDPGACCGYTCVNTGDLNDPDATCA